MIKFVFCISVAPNSWIYWHNRHGPLVLSFQKMLGIKKYIQLHTIATPLDAALRDNRGGPEPFDGIAEVWWESLEVVQRSLADPEAQAAWAALIEDEKRFIDLQHSPLWFGEEKVMFSEQAEA